MYNSRVERTFCRTYYIANKFSVGHLKLEQLKLNKKTVGQIIFFSDVEHLAVGQMTVDQTDVVQLIVESLSVRLKKYLAKIKKNCSITLPW